MSKLKSKLPGAKNGAPDMDAFISGAGIKSAATEDLVVKPKEAYPWQDSVVREDVMKLFNLRLPEPYLLKLKYIAEHTPNSMQKFCWQILQNAIDEKIEELTQSNDII